MNLCLHFWLFPLHKFLDVQLLSNNMDILDSQLIFSKYCLKTIYLQEHDITYFSTSVLALDIIIKK